MTRITALVLAATLAAAPAFAGGLGFDLPRLDFPGPSTEVPGQGCAAPATIDGSRCAPS